MDLNTGDSSSVLTVLQLGTIMTSNVGIREYQTVILSLCAIIVIQSTKPVLLVRRSVLECVCSSVIVAMSTVLCVK